MQEFMLAFAVSVRVCLGRDALGLRVRFELRIVFFLRVRDVFSESFFRARASVWYSFPKPNCPTRALSLVTSDDVQSTSLDIQMAFDGVCSTSFDVHMTSSGLHSMPSDVQMTSGDVRNMSLDIQMASDAVHRTSLGAEHVLGPLDDVR